MRKTSFYRKRVSLTLLILLTITIFACGGGDEDIPNTGGDPADGSNTASTTGIDQFANSNIYSLNTQLLSNNVMQGFNLDSDGSVWYTQSTENKHQLNWIKAKPNKSTSIATAGTDYMKLLYFGHGTNTGVEEDGSDRYLWVGAYATCGADGHYWGDKVVGRVKYVKGKTIKTNECNEYYFIGGDYTELHPSVDNENDLLTINYSDKNNSSYRCFVVYKLSDAKKASMTNVTITCSNGFETNNPASGTLINVPVYCRDLTSLSPVARVKFRKTGYGAANATYYDWQGYDVHKDRLYYADGQSNYSLVGSWFTDDTSQAYITVFDFAGNIVEERTQVAFVSDRKKLSDIGVTVLGHLEAEGVKVYKGKMYLGFTSRGISQTDTKHYQNIFVFDESSK